MADIKKINANGTSYDIATTWGKVKGTLSNQTDLSQALADKANTGDIKDSTITFKQGTATKGTITLNQANAATITLDPGGDPITYEETDKKLVLTQGGVSVGGAAEWGSITGDIEDQTDLQESLEAKQDELHLGKNLAFNTYGAHGLPFEYQEVEYIKNIDTHTAYDNYQTWFDTDYQAKVGTKFVFDYQVDTYYGDEALTGTSWHASPRGQAFAFGWANNVSTTNMIYQVGNEVGAINGLSRDTNRHKISFRLESGTSLMVSVDNSAETSYTITTFTDSAKSNLLSLMGRKSNTGTFTDSCIRGRMYYAALYDGNVLVHEYIPCYRKSDNVVGVYDTVTSTFVEQQGIKSINAYNPDYSGQKLLECDGVASWGSIGGNLGNQTDLQTELNKIPIITSSSSDFSGNGFYAYEGSPVVLKHPFKRSVYLTIDPSWFGISVAPQSMCAYGDYMFVCYTNGPVGVINMRTKQPVGKFTLPNADSTLHASNCGFGPETPSGASFPAFYVNRTFFGTSGDSECYAYKIVQSGSTFTATLIQTIHYPRADWGAGTGNNYCDYMPSDDGLYMYIIGYTNYQSVGGYTQIKKFKMPTLSQGSNVTLQKADSLLDMDAPSVTVIQGCCINGDRIYIGNNNGARPTGIIVCDTLLKKEISNIPMPIGEPEGLAYWNGNLYMQPNGNNVYQIEFPQVSNTSINVKYFDHITIVNQPTKTTYTAGEFFDPTGMVVNGVYTDGSAETVTGYTYTPARALVVGDTNIQIKYKTKTATQAITVYEPASISGIEITTQPTKTVYTIGEVFNPAGMVVSGIYGSVRTPVTGWTYSPTTGLVEGSNTITVSYTEDGSTFTTTTTVTAQSEPSATTIVLNDSDLVTPCTFPSTNTGYIDTETLYRTSYILQLRDDVLDGATSITFDSTNLKKCNYSRQLFNTVIQDYQAGQAFAASNTVFNDTAWQYGTTTMDLTQYSGVKNFGIVMAYNGAEKPDFTGFTIVINY